MTGGERGAWPFKYLLQLVMLGNPNTSYIFVSSFFLQRERERPSGVATSEEKEDEEAEESEEKEDEEAEEESALPEPVPTSVGPLTSSTSVVVWTPI